MDLTEFSPSSALVTVVLLSFLPFVAVMTTAFAKIVVVLSLLRNALGLQQTPPNILINGLALILTIYVMYPIGLTVMDELQQKPETEALALSSMEVVKEPLRAFLSKHSNSDETEFFYHTIIEMASSDKADSITAEDFVVLVPSFITSELTEAFKIGFLLFLPFIVIDLVIANILMALGMMMLSPTIISLPFKLLLFVMIDGWAKLSHGLVLTYL